MVAKDIVLEWAVTEILEEKIANSYQIQLFERQIRHGKMAQKKKPFNVLEVSRNYFSGIRKKE